MYAVIKTGGKQYKVAVGDKLKVEKLTAEEGSVVKLEQVLMLADGAQVKFGAPLLSTTVSATVLAHGRGSKIRVFKMKRRKDYRRTLGHRQAYTELQITAIGTSTAHAKASATAPATTKSRSSAGTKQKSVAPTTTKKVAKTKPTTPSVKTAKTATTAKAKSAVKTATTAKVATTAKTAKVAKVAKTKPTKQSAKTATATKTKRSADSRKA